MQQDSAAIRCANWLKSLPERFNLPPKQEWSEEDEKMLSLIIGEFEAIKIRASTQFEITIADKKIAWLKSEIQCPRMSSLFRTETLDGKVSYSDNNRAYCVNIENPSDTYYSAKDRVVDEFFPITMPYMPEKGRYKVYCQTFLTDKRNGDFDTQAILYFTTPDGKRVDVNRYQTEKDGKMVDITKEEYEALLEKRIDRLRDTVADTLLWTLLSNSAPEKEIKRRETAWRSLLPETKNGIENRLRELCVFYENPEHYKYNCFSVRQALCCGELSDFDNEPELVEIGNYLQGILKVIQ